MYLLLPGVRADGSVKVRPIDDMSASLINAATNATEKLAYDTLDHFFEMVKRLAIDTEAVHASVSGHCLNCVLTNGDIAFAGGIATV